MTTMTMLDDATFSDVVSPGSGTVVVEFTAEWCGACKVLAPALAVAAAELEGRARFYAVDADFNPAVVTRYGVRSLPTLLVFRDGELADRIVGAMGVAALRGRLGATE